MGGTDLAVSASARMKVLENRQRAERAALRQVAGYYAYDNNATALRTTN